MRTSLELGDDLPWTFTFREAHGQGVSQHRLAAMRKAGLVDELGRGLYRRADAPAEVDVDLVEIAKRAPKATLCLTSALARHGLVDLIPPAIDVAIPRGTRTPRSRAPVLWHRFAVESFDIGREVFMVDDQTRLGVYSAPRSIVDMLRLRHLESEEVALEALRNWLRVNGNSPAELLTVARSFPRVERKLIETLKVLL